MSKKKDRGRVKMIIVMQIMRCLNERTCCQEKILKGAVKGEGVCLKTGVKSAGRASVLLLTRVGGGSSVSD